MIKITYIQLHPIRKSKVKSSYIHEIRNYNLSVYEPLYVCLITMLSNNDQGQHILCCNNLLQYWKEKPPNRKLSETLFTLRAPKFAQLK